MQVIEIVLKNWSKNHEKHAPRYWKNSGYALEGLHFPRFPTPSKSCGKYTRKRFKMNLKSIKKWSGVRLRTFLKNVCKNNENIVKIGIKKWGPKSGFFVLFATCGSKVSRDGPREPPRHPPGSNLLQNGFQNDPKIIKQKPLDLGLDSWLDLGLTLCLDVEGWKLFVRFGLEHNIMFINYVELQGLSETRLAK